MKKYIYNMSEDEFYTVHDCNVEISQVEWSDVFRLEIFPPNQSEESFEDAEFHTLINLSKRDITGKLYIGHILEDLKLPENWTDEDIKVFTKELWAVLENFKLLKVVYICYECHEEVEAVQELKLHNGVTGEYCPECYEKVQQREALRSGTNTRVYIIAQEDNETEEHYENLPIEIIDQLSLYSLSKAEYQEWEWLDYKDIVSKDNFKVKVVGDTVVRVWR